MTAQVLFINDFSEKYPHLNAVENMKIADIVIIEEDNTERSKWPLARVIKLFYGKDGVVRSVQLKTNDSTLYRSVAKLCVLEEGT